MMFPKTKPYRSKAFLKFCHELGGECANCHRYWHELHHFGNDGGKGMKPSDNAVVRLCRDCHYMLDHKLLSFVKRGDFNTAIMFMKDALELNRAYIEYLEEK